jgi:antitoxin MazE
MTITIRKWGNSMGIIIPKIVLDELKMKAGDELSLTSDGEKTITLKSRNRKQELEDLLSRITPENMHDEEFPALIGNERW